MRRFLRKTIKALKFSAFCGALWTTIDHIIETPLFVNSELTGMVQIADLCALALRRYFGNNEADLLDRIRPRFDTRHGRVVGVRHFTRDDCNCDLCNARRESIA